MPAHAATAHYFLHGLRSACDRRVRVACGGLPAEADQPYASGAGAGAGAAGGSAGGVRRDAVVGSRAVSGEECDAYVVVGEARVLYFCSEDGLTKLVGDA